jgi:hypothetical protein
MTLYALREVLFCKLEESGKSHSSLQNRSQLDVLAEEVLRIALSDRLQIPMEMIAIFTSAAIEAFLLSFPPQSGYLAGTQSSIWGRLELEGIFSYGQEVADLVRASGRD